MLLITALSCGHESVVKALIEREDLEINVKDERGQTALDGHAR
jgi:ankyrin repeat protein